MSTITHNIEAEEDLVDEISTLIKARRTELGISQANLSRMAFGSTTNREWISKIENGQRTGMSIKTLSKVLKALKVKMTFEFVED